MYTVGRARPLLALNEAPVRNHGGLPLQLTGGVDQVPDRGVLDQETGAVSGDAYAAVISDITLLRHALEKTGALLLQHRFRR